MPGRQAGGQASISQVVGVAGLAWLSRGSGAPGFGKGPSELEELSNRTIRTHTHTHTFGHPQLNNWEIFIQEAAAAFHLKNLLIVGFYFIYLRI